MRSAGVEPVAWRPQGPRKRCERWSVPLPCLPTSAHVTPPMNITSTFRRLPLEAAAAASAAAFAEPCMAGGRAAGLGRKGLCCCAAAQRLQPYTCSNMQARSMPHATRPAGRREAHLPPFHRHALLVAGLQHLKLLAWQLLQQGLYARPALGCSSEGRRRAGGGQACMGGEAGRARQEGAGAPPRTHGHALKQAPAARVGAG